MKIAFVGKGGSGKSTMTALFLRYMQQQHQNVLAIDADLNMNLAGLLGVTVQPEKVLANPDVAHRIRTHLMGSNERIASPDMFLPTTPPGQGSNLLLSANDEALRPYAVKISDNMALLTVGTYSAESIGQHCYHSDLFVAENLLSHIDTAQGLNVVCDMVAGTDAFAYSLHLQFDAIVLICEPTPESVEVCRLYLGLAEQAGIAGLIHVVGNKVEDADDEAFIATQIGRKMLGTVPVMKTLKKARQAGAAVTADMLQGDLPSVMEAIVQQARSPAIPATIRQQKLYELHATLNGKQWVQLAYGDVMTQIDPDFKAEAA